MNPSLDSDTLKNENTPQRSGRPRRIILAVFCLLLFAIGLLWIMGGQEYEYQAFIVIDAEKDLIFQFLTEPDLLPHWMEGVTKVEELTDNGHEVGARAIATVEENGNRMELLSEVMENDPPESLTVKVSSDMFDVLNRYQLESSGDATRVSIQMKARYVGWVRIFAPFIGGSIEQKLNDDFASLKRVTEDK